MTTRALFITAGAVLLLLFHFPLWRITLLAPQYPDGVTLLIYINKIGGAEEGTLQNINILNHYVGMKPIVPESIPELVYFPWVTIAFTVLAVIAAAIHKKWLYITWVSLLIVGISLGIYDFYLWEYDYGHNLDPKAPMVFEDQTYQPPLIGRKTLLNFVALSYPHVGGYLIGLSIALGLLAIKLKKK
ncbi:MAG: hypothetical protein HKN22_01150 [Bacteroidia bacterium]|nr:hypothetical protein [Bacteroidia bacterium]